MKVYVLWYYCYGVRAIYAITETIEKAKEIQKKCNLYDLYIVEEEVLK